MPDEYNGNQIPEDQNPDPRNGDQSDNIPDWMKEAGWETSSGTFDESKPVFDDLEDDEIVPADIPAWLEEAAPEGFNSDPNAIPAFEGLDMDEPFITTGDLVPPPSMQPPADTGEPSEGEEPQEDTGPSEFDIPSWLENLELDEDSQETAVAWLENMPESLRATEEELKAAEEMLAEKQPENIEEPVDELAWVDEIPTEQEMLPSEAEDDLAALSEDLVASELLPESSESEEIFAQDEIKSMDGELPSWLHELGEDQPEPGPTEETKYEEPPDSPPEPEEFLDESIPDWLKSTDAADISSIPEVSSDEPHSPPTAEESDVPDWLDGFEDSASDGGEKSEGLEWLDNLQGEEPALEGVEPDSESAFREPTQGIEPDLSEIAAEEPIYDDSAPSSDDILETEAVSPNDETLNTQIPDWLSKIGESDEIETEAQPAEDEFESLEEFKTPSAEDDFGDTDNWLDQLDERPSQPSQEQIVSVEGETMDWLDDLTGTREEPSPEGDYDFNEPIPDESPPSASAVELETAKYFTDEETEGEGDELPDWLAELSDDEEDPSLSLEEAIRQSDRDLNEAELDFLNKSEEKQREESDWLSKLDQVERPPARETSSPAIDLSLPADDLSSDEDVSFIEGVDEQIDETIVSGGILERLQDTSEFKSDEDVPHWLEDLKEEEDPQETAVLWLQQFVNQGEEVDIKSEIKRYTDELDPGDSIPKWMEDLKNEEDPQTTAMLWLEKLSADRKPSLSPEPSTDEEDTSGWLADLEREAAESNQEQAAKDIKDFGDSDEGWLADLEIEEKIKTTEEDIPDWSKAEEEKQGEPTEAEPPWMKATSPLEGDFYTDELAGGEEKEVEIPDWLAGYAEGEEPEEADTENQLPGEEEEEYTWLAASDAPKPTREPLNLNQAAISQLESILGISHQVARGIVTYREKHGPFQDISDLKNVPEIIDEQTIEILKPEVFIEAATPDEESIVEPSVETTAPPVEPSPPRPKPPKKPSAGSNFEEILVTARTRLNEKQIKAAVEEYKLLIKKKKFLGEVIDDLKKATLDHPLEILIHQTLGDAFMKKDMLDDALEAYSKAEDLLP